MGIENKFLFLVISIVCIMALLLFSYFNEPNKVLIKDIQGKSVGEKVSFNGNVVSSRFFENSSFQILNLKDDSGSITGTLNTKIKLEFNKNITYLILGKVSLYKNETQISVDKISI